MKIILSENQIQSIIRQQLIENQLINEGNMGMLEKSIYSLMFMGLLSVETLYQYLQHNPYIPEQQKEIIIQDAEDFEEYQEKEMWREIANDAIITVYNAVPAQCNADCGTTASGFKLNLNNVASHKIVATTAFATVQQAGTAQVSERSKCASNSCFVSKSTDFRGFCIVGIAFIVMVMTKSSPLVIPPSIPPALFVFLIKNTYICKVKNKKKKNLKALLIWSIIIYLVEVIYHVLFLYLSTVQIIVLSVHQKQCTRTCSLI